jgi:hypothetical protein
MIRKASIGDFSCRCRWGNYSEELAAGQLPTSAKYLEELQLTFGGLQCHNARGMEETFLPITLL